MFTGDVEAGWVVFRNASTGVAIGRVQPPSGLAKSVRVEGTEAIIDTTGGRELWSLVGTLGPTFIRRVP